MRKVLIYLVLILCKQMSWAQDKTVARVWNEALLEAVRNDFARPTVHARNLFHVSAAMYDAWSVLHSANPYLLGNTIRGFRSEFDGFSAGSPDVPSVTEKAISHAAYRLISHRFANSPGWDDTKRYIDSLFNHFGLDESVVSLDYSNGSAEVLGNYIALQYINYGLTDGANEQNDYANLYYEPINDFLSPESSGNPNLTAPNRWQPLGFNVFIDQSGNEIPGAVPEFLSPEWGNVNPFSFNLSDSEVFSRDGSEYRIFHDPGPPPYFNPESEVDTLYQWGFAMVALWSSHLDPDLPATLDISPANLGNISIEDMPTSFEDYNDFYGYFEGGDISEGHSLNPITGMPYEPQVVKLGDYARVLAEFWADGPDSETPPGHWFTILNYVSDHPELEKRFEGEGDIVDDLEWDVKSYFILGGTMHDVAISAWGIKGYYDYVRPISAIRYMGDLGQSSDPDLPNYDPNGLPIIEDYIELVAVDDPLVGPANQHLNKLKVKAWRGPDYINDASVDYAGVDWILIENWWPYQRPTFVTPPFAGYVSGHSTYSRAAAEVMTLLTGSEYFPGGLGEFVAPMNEFLVFEEGPSQDVILQWATYRDASDQCSLSRIWGGIHPSFDDIPGRLIGEKIGIDAFAFAKNVFAGIITSAKEERSVQVFPNPFTSSLSINGGSYKTFAIMDLAGNTLLYWSAEKWPSKAELAKLDQGVYLLNMRSDSKVNTLRIIKE